jgi:hypothetical protein
MALGSEPDGMYHKVLSPIESEVAANEDSKEENLEETGKEGNMFLITDKVVRKEDSQIRKVHSCPYCQRSFSRPWRLASHVRSHTGQVSSFAVHVASTQAWIWRVFSPLE